MKRSQTIAALSIACLLATVYAGHARQAHTPLYRLTLAEGANFAQTIDIAPNDNFHVVTRIDNVSYEISGVNRWTDRGMIVNTTVRHAISTPVAPPEAAVNLRGKPERETGGRFNATLILSPGGKASEIGGTTEPDSDGERVSSRLSLSLAEVPEPKP